MLIPGRTFFLFTHFQILFIGYLLAKEFQRHQDQHLLLMRKLSSAHHEITAESNVVFLLSCDEDNNCHRGKSLKELFSYVTEKNPTLIFVQICADYLKRHESKKTNFVSYFIEQKDSFKIAEAFLSSCEKEVIFHLLKKESILLGTIVKDNVPLPFITSKKEFSRQFPKELYPSLKHLVVSESKEDFKIEDNYFIPCFNFEALANFCDNCCCKCCLSSDISNYIMRKLFFKKIKCYTKYVRDNSFSLNRLSRKNEQKDIFSKKLFCIYCDDMKDVCKHNNKLCLKDNIGLKYLTKFPVRKKRQIPKQNSKHSSLENHDIKNTNLFNQYLYYRYHFLPDKYALLSSKLEKQSVKNSTNKTTASENISEKSNKYEKGYTISELLLRKRRNSPFFMKDSLLRNVGKHLDGILSNSQLKNIARKKNETALIPNINSTTEEILTKENSSLSTNDGTPFDKTTYEKVYHNIQNPDSNTFKRSNISLNTESKLNIKEKSKVIYSLDASRKNNSATKTESTHHPPISKNEFNFDFLNLTNFKSLDNNSKSTSSIKFTDIINEYFSNEQAKNNFTTDSTHFSFAEMLINNKTIESWSSKKSSTITSNSNSSSDNFGKEDFTVKQNGKNILSLNSRNMEPSTYINGKESPFEATDKIDKFTVEEKVSEKNKITNSYKFSTLTVSENPFVNSSLNESTTTSSINKIENVSKKLGNKETNKSVENGVSVPHVYNFLTVAFSEPYDDNNYGKENRVTNSGKATLEKKPSVDFHTFDEYPANTFSNNEPKIMKTDTLTVQMDTYATKDFTPKVSFTIASSGNPFKIPFINTDNSEFHRDEFTNHGTNKFSDDIQTDASFEENTHPISTLDVHKTVLTKRSPSLTTESFGFENNDLLLTQNKITSSTSLRETQDKLRTSKFNGDGMFTIKSEFNPSQTSEKDVIKDVLTFEDSYSAKKDSFTSLETDGNDWFIETDKITSIDDLNFKDYLTQSTDGSKTERDSLEMHSKSARRNTDLSIIEDVSTSIDDYFFTPVELTFNFRDSSTFEELDKITTKGLVSDMLSEKMRSFSQLPHSKKLGTEETEAIQSNMNEISDAESFLLTKYNPVSTINDRFKDVSTEKEVSNSFINKNILDDHALMSTEFFPYSSENSQTETFKSKIKATGRSKTKNFNSEISTNKIKKVTQLYDDRIKSVHDDETVFTGAELSTVQNTAFKDNADNRDMSNEGKTEGDKQTFPFNEDEAEIDEASTMKHKTTGTTEEEFILTNKNEFLSKQPGVTMSELLEYDSLITKDNEISSKEQINTQKVRTTSTIIDKITRNNEEEFILMNKNEFSSKIPDSTETGSLDDELSITKSEQISNIEGIISTQKVRTTETRTMKNKVTQNAEEKFLLTNENEFSTKILSSVAAKFKDESSITENEKFTNSEELISTRQVRTTDTSMIKNKIAGSTPEVFLLTDENEFSSKMPSARETELLEFESSVTKGEEIFSIEEIFSTQKVRPNEASIMVDKVTRNIQEEFLLTDENELLSKIPNTIKTELLELESSATRDGKVSTSEGIISTQQVRTSETSKMKNKISRNIEEKFLLTKENEFSSKTPSAIETELLELESSITNSKEIFNIEEIFSTYKARTNETSTMTGKVTRNTQEEFLLTDENEFSSRISASIDTEFEDESSVTKNEKINISEGIINTRQVRTTDKSTIKNKIKRSTEEEILLTNENEFSSKIPSARETELFELESSVTRNEKVFTSSGIISTQQIRTSETITMKNKITQSTEEQFLLTDENEFSSKIIASMETEFKDESSIKKDEKNITNEPVSTLYLLDKKSKTSIDTNWSTSKQEISSTGKTHTLLQDNKQTDWSNPDVLLVTDILSSETESISIPSDETNKSTKEDKNSSPTENHFTTPTIHSDKDLDAASDKILIRTDRDVSSSINRDSTLENFENTDYLKVKINSETDMFPTSTSIINLNKKYADSESHVSSVSIKNFTPSNTEINVINYEKNKQLNLGDKEISASSVDSDLLSTDFSLNGRGVTNNEITKSDNGLLRTERQVLSASDRSNSSPIDIFLKKNSITDKSDEASVSVNKINSTEQSKMVINEDNMLPPVFITKESNLTYKYISNTEKPVLIITENNELGSNDIPIEEISITNNEKKFTNWQKITIPNNKIPFPVDVITGEGSTTNKELRTTQMITEDNKLLSADDSTQTDSITYQSTTTNKILITTRRPASMRNEDNKSLSDSDSAQKDSTTYKNITTNKKLRTTQRPESVRNEDNKSLSDRDSAQKETYKSITTNNVLRTTQRPASVRNEDNKSLSDSDSAQKDSTTYKSITTNKVLRTTQRPASVRNEDNKSLSDSDSAQKDSTTYKSITTNKVLRTTQRPASVRNENNKSLSDSDSAQKDSTTYKSITTNNVLRTTQRPIFVNNKDDKLSSTSDPAQENNTTYKSVATNKKLDFTQTPILVNTEDNKLPSFDDSLMKDSTTYKSVKTTDLANGSKDKIYLSSEGNILSSVDTASGEYITKKDYLATGSIKEMISNERKMTSSTETTKPSLIRTSLSQSSANGEGDATMNVKFQTERQELSSSEGNQDSSTNIATEKANTMNEDESVDEVDDELIRTERQVISSSQGIMTSGTTRTDKKDVNTTGILENTTKLSIKNISISNDNSVSIGQSDPSINSADDISTIDDISNENPNLGVYTDTNILTSEKSTPSSTEISNYPEFNSDVNDNTMDQDDKTTDQLEDEIIRTERQALSSSQGILTSGTTITDIKEINTTVIFQNTTKLRIDNNNISISNDNSASMGRSDLSINSADDISTIEHISNANTDLSVFTDTNILTSEKDTSSSTEISNYPELNSDVDDNITDQEDKTTDQLEDELIRTERQISSSEESQDFSKSLTTGKDGAINKDDGNTDQIGNDIIPTEMQILSTSQEIIPTLPMTTDKEEANTIDALENTSELTISSEENIGEEETEISSNDVSDISTIGDIETVNINLDISTASNAITAEESTDFSTETNMSTELNSDEDDEILDQKDGTTIQLDEELIRTERQVISSSQALSPSTDDTTENEEADTKNIFQTKNELSTLKTDLNMPTDRNVISEMPDMSANNTNRDLPKEDANGNINVNVDISTDLNLKTISTDNFGANTETNSELDPAEETSVDLEGMPTELSPPTDTTLFMKPTTSILTPETKTENPLPTTRKNEIITNSEMVSSPSTSMTLSEANEKDDFKTTITDIITSSLPTTVKQEITSTTDQIYSENQASSMSVSQLPETRTDVKFSSTASSATTETEKPTTSLHFKTTMESLSSLNEESSTTTLTTTMLTSEISPIPFHFTIDADYDEIVGSRKEQFEENLWRQIVIEMRLPFECVQNMKVSKGSIEVNFDLVPNPQLGHIADEKALKAAADELKRMIDSGQLKISDIEGNSLVVVPIDPPTKAPAATEQTSLILGIVIGAFILTVISVAVAVIIMKRKANGIHRLTPIEEARSKLPSYREIPFQEALFMKGPAKNKLMLGKYCYSTGKWLGPGPEPMSYIPPESAVYRPPTDSEVRQTPRPPTAVRERLKNNWELDWDSMVFSR